MSSEPTATSSRPAVCLAMIVRDEERVLERCIDSVSSLITHWIIVDTGSVDGTLHLIRKLLGHLPGELHSIEWPDDFAAARNVVLARSRRFMSETSDGGGHLLFIDADDVIDGRSTSVVQRLIYDGTTSIYGALRDGNYSHQRLISAHLDACVQWHGSRHEWLEFVPDAKAVYSGDVILHYGHDGYRRRNRSETLVADQNILTPNIGVARDWRSAFYRGATLEALGDEEAAKTTYLAALDLGLTAENRDQQWQAAWGVARLSESGGAEEVARASRVYAFMHELYPDRAEALLGLSRISLSRGAAEIAFELADASFSMHQPTDALIFDWTAYGLRRCEQLVMAAKACGDRAYVQRALERCRAASFDLAEASQRDRLLKILE
ncbi:MAG: glycosyltransferase [Betaproteobacteria bacterium]|nr:MAG: glycosyltransferase [Betaproteobacteria bacterium]